MGEETIINTFLRWAGSKKRLFPKILPYWGNGFQRYIEPFMGSAALFFRLNPTTAILSDINSELVETFCAVRDHPKAVYNRLLKIPLGKESYYLIRNKDCSQIPLIDRAARFIFLNRFCFNGLYRTNLSGKFNVPYASSRTGNLPTLIELYSASKALSCADIKKRDFEEIIQEVQFGDFVYMDPPFAVKNRRIFCQYGPDSFGINDLKRLSSALSEIDRRGATFLVSYALCSESLQVFENWNVKRVLTQRSIAGFSENRKNAFEVLVSNQNIIRKN